MNQFSIDIADWNFVPLVRGLARTVRRSPRAMLLAERRKRPSGMSMASEVSRTRRIQGPCRVAVIALWSRGIRARYSGLERQESRSVGHRQLQESGFLAKDSNRDIPAAHRIDQPDPARRRSFQRQCKALLRPGRDASQVIT